MSADRRVYPSKLAKRERDLLTRVARFLRDPNPRDGDALAEDVRHRLACAARYDETREHRLTEYERLVTSYAMRGTLRCHIEDGHAEEARAVTRALVRLVR